MRHIRQSTAPCWWSDDAGAETAFSTLTWTSRIRSAGAQRPRHRLPGLYRPRTGRARHLRRSRDSLPNATSLHDLHGRCFALFEAVARIGLGRPDELPAMSRRELECLKLTSRGHTSEEIAKLLKLSVHTANQYLTQTTQKLNAVNRMHAVAKALRLGLDRLDSWPYPIRRLPPSARIGRIMACSIAAARYCGVLLRLRIRLLERHVVDLDRGMRCRHRQLEIDDGTFAACSSRSSTMRGLPVQQTCASPPWPMRNASRHEVQLGR